MLTMLLKASEDQQGAGVWGDMALLLAGGALTLIGSLIATHISQKHQRRMAEEARVEARRGPARTLILNILQTGQRWTFAADYLDELIEGRTLRVQGLGAQKLADRMSGLLIEKAESIQQLSRATAEADLVFHEDSLLTAIYEVQAAARETGEDELLSRLDAEHDASHLDPEPSERTNRMQSALQNLHSAAAAYLRTPLAEPTKKPSRR